MVEVFDGPWLCLGGFNNSMGHWEKWGGNAGEQSKMYIRDFMHNTGAIDLGFNGNKFTWTNKRWGKDCIRERLDRGVCNDGWRIIFPHAIIWHLPAPHSDHSPILLDTNVKVRKKGRPFRFETVWSRDPTCVINEAWQSNWIGNPSYQLCRKMQKTREALSIWRKEVFGAGGTKIKGLLDQLKKVQMVDPSEENAIIEAVTTQ